MIPSALNIAQFADHIRTIEMLYNVDPDFKTLCDDYVTTRMNIEKYNENGLNDQGKPEYEQLSYELEKEILDYVRKIS